MPSRQNRFEFGLGLQIFAREADQASQMLNDPDLVKAIIYIQRILQRNSIQFVELLRQGQARPVKGHGTNPIPREGLLRADGNALCAGAARLVLDNGNAIHECDAMLVADRRAQAITFALVAINDNHVPPSWRISFTPSPRKLF